MRIAFDVRVLQQALRNAPAGGLGGPGRYVLGLVGSLLGREDDNTYLLLVDQGPVPAELESLAADRERVSLLAVGLPDTVWSRRHGRLGTLARLIEFPALARQIREAQVDLVHLPEQPPPPLSLERAVITLHDLTPFVEASAPKSALSHGLGVRRLERAVKSAGAVVCVSESTARDAERLLHVDRGRLVVSYPGVDTTVFRPDAANGRGNGRVTSSYFLHVGVLFAHKNPEGLLGAFSEVARDFPDVQLICVGPYQVAPQVEARVRELAADLHVDDRVQLRRDCSDEQLAALYRGAAGLVFPSFYEGFGFPVVEALACGTPCVVSHGSSLSEVGGDLAVFVDPTDHDEIAAAMRRLLLDPQLLARVRAEGPRWASRFSWDEAAERMASLYERSVG
jgi:glycosyltransferase involved in cell wall biosynthesis